MAEAAPSLAPPQPMQRVESTDGKLQKLLGLARARLQEQQNQIASRDALVAELRATLDAERLQRAEEEAARRIRTPRRALCHVNDRALEEPRWVLFEFEESDALEWKCFGSAAELNDFVRRDPGQEPIEVPEALMPVGEARNVRQQAEASVQHITEEFRRHRVQAEISRKQREAAHRETTSRHVRSEQQQLLDARDALLRATQPPEAAPEAVLRLEDKLRERCAELEAETKRLRAAGTAGAHAALAQQWRVRYATCVDEKEALVTEVALLRTGAAASSEYAELERALDELKLEYKLYRANALRALEAQRRGDDSHTAQATRRPRAGHALETFGERGGERARSAGTARRGKPDANTEKLTYLKNLVSNYLATHEPQAKEHMERAMLTVLGFSAEEKKRLTEQPPARGYFG